MRTRPNKTLRELRRTIGHTQRQFAAAVGVSKDTVVSWENGRNRLPAEAAMRIRAQTGADVAALIAGTGAPRDFEGNLYTAASLAKWQKMSRLNRGDDVGRVWGCASDALHVVMQAAAKRGCFGPVWLSFGDWLERARRDFKLAPQIDAVLKERAHKDQLTMTYKDWRRCVKEMGGSYAAYYGFKDDRRKKDGQKLTLAVVSQPVWAAYGDMRQQPDSSVEYSLAP